jgi:hypothetical protein
MTLLQREWNQSRASNQEEIALKTEHREGVMGKNLLSLLKLGSAVRLCLPVQGIVDTTAVSSVKAEPIWFKSSSPGPVLVIVHIEDSVV